MPRLDVESDEQRRERLGNLFSTLSTPPASAGPSAPPSRPYAVPESDALARVRAFLPLMAQANADLAARAESEGREAVVIDAGILRNLDANDEDSKGKGEDSKGRGDHGLDEDGENEDEGEGEGEDEDEEKGQGESQQGRRAVEMDVGVGVFDVKGDVGRADLGPVVERDAAVWSQAKEDK